MDHATYMAIIWQIDAAGRYERLQEMLAAGYYGALDIKMAQETASAAYKQARANLVRAQAKRVL